MGGPESSRITKPPCSVWSQRRRIERQNIVRLRHTDWGLIEAQAATGSGGFNTENLRDGNSPS